MSDDPKCVAGCVPFYGGEKRHHKDCPYYPESLTKLNADRIEELEANLKMAEVSLRVINALDPEASMDGCSRYTLITIVGLMGGKARDALAKLTGEKP